MGVRNFGPAPDGRGDRFGRDLEYDAGRARRG